MKWLLLPISLLLLTSCMFPAGPKTWTGAPSIAGTLSHEGTPVANAKVQLTDNQQNNVESATDSAGQFSIGPLGKKAHAAYIGLFGLGESGVRWTLSFEQDGNWIIGWKSAGGISYAPRETVIADCDVTRSPAEAQIAGTNHPGTVGTGFCQLSLKLTKK